MMTVKEMIDKLSKFPPESPVRIWGPHEDGGGLCRLDINGVRADWDDADLPLIFPYSDGSGD
jgi:hypothetical protein